MERTFIKLHANCRMTVAAEEACPVVAMLRPRSGDCQWMVQERYELSPPVSTTEYVDDHGNLCQRLTVPKGELGIEIDMIMVTETHIAVDQDAEAVPVAQLPHDVLKFLLQSRYCPSDKMEDKAVEISGDGPSGYRQVASISKWIHENVEYRYGVSDQTTDALDTLSAGAGVCRDFSHVGIALCRALHIPARYVVGYLHELEPMDMHAWFEAFIGGRWYAFDATQEEPRGGRIVVAYGRDAADVAFLSNYGPLEVRAMNVRVREIPLTDSLPFPMGSSR